MKRSGVADLPLHGGRVPHWLAERMTKLGAAIAEAIVRDYGTSAFLSRLSDPFWFQALGAVMGMDWHSSGITTSVMGALKRGLALRAARRLCMPVHHEVRAANVDLKRLGAVLAVAYERELHDFAELLLLENLGPRTLQSLALIAEVVHGVPSRFIDPARFSFAHGGKDRHPFPVPLKTYDQALDVLRNALDAAKVGDKDKIDGLRRLDRFVRAIESELKPEADLDAVIAREKAISPALDGRSVFDDKPKQRQLSLF